MNRSQIALMVPFLGITLIGCGPMPERGMPMHSPERFPSPTETPGIDPPLSDSFVVGETRIGGHFQRQCSSTSDAGWTCEGLRMSGKRSHLGWYKQVESSKVVKCCEGISKLQDHRLDPSAVAALVHDQVLSLSLNWLRANVGAKSAWQPIDLVIFPKYETIAVGETAKAESNVLSDNLAYTPEVFALSVLPVSADRKQSNQGLPYLWEIPFAVAHELGHHIDNMSRRRVEPPTQCSRTLGLNPKWKFLQRALQEGIADVVGWLLVGMKSDPFQSIPELNDRDPLLSNARSIDLKESFLDQELQFNSSNPHAYGTAVAGNLARRIMGNCELMKYNADQCALYGMKWMHFFLDLNAKALDAVQCDVEGMFDVWEANTKLADQVQTELFEDETTFSDPSIVAVDMLYFQLGDGNGPDENHRSKRQFILP